MHLFNIRKWIEKILLIYLSKSKDLYIIFLNQVNLVAIVNKIIYD